MKEILIFAGTTEGRKLSEDLSATGIAHTICVATEYGETVLKEHPLVKVHCGRMNQEEIREYIKNLLYFIPIGFFVTVYKNKTSTLKKIMMVIYFGIFIELVQYVLNTATVSLVDLISYIIGFILGGVIKKLLDMLRKFITRGEECTIFDF